MIKGQKRLLLILAMLGDLFEDVADAGGLMSFSYKQVYGFVPQKYKKHNFEMAIRNALKIGRIEKVVKQGKVYLKLTPRGRTKLIDYFPLFKFQKSGWDGKWRIVFFDIQEKNKRVRERFRRELYELGFGKLQRSVYISPFPIEKEMGEFIESLGLKGRVHLITSSGSLTEDDRELSERVWHLEEINEGYQRVLALLGEKPLTEKKSKKIKSLYLDVLSADPFLPKELLPKGWLAEKAERGVLRLEE